MGWRVMPGKKLVSVIVVSIAAGTLITACADPMTIAGGGSGCRGEFRGVTGVNRPQTSDLSCADINQLTFGVPSEPQGYLITGDSPHLLWKCRYFGTGVPHILL